MASIQERAPSGGRLNGYQPHLSHPFWDLSIVLEGHQFEPLESVSNTLLVLLVALSSLKRIWPVCSLCWPFFYGFFFASGLVKFLLWPRLGYVPKVASTPFRTQEVTLEAQWCVASWALPSAGLETGSITRTIGVSLTIFLRVLVVETEELLSPSRGCLIG